MPKRSHPLNKLEDPNYPPIFFAKGVPDANGCLNWPHAQRASARPRIKFCGRRTTVQRVAWQLAYGPIPDGLGVFHICRNPLCIRVTHLCLKPWEEIIAIHRDEFEHV